MIFSHIPNCDTFWCYKFKLILSKVEFVFHISLHNMINGVSLEQQMFLLHYYGKQHDNIVFHDMIKKYIVKYIYKYIMWKIMS